MAENMRLAVVAIGGNALIPDAERLSIADQYETICSLAEHIAEMEAEGWRIVVTHGNGPQVGFIMRRSELASGEISPVPLDMAGADLQGGIGYMFIKALHNSLRRRKLSRLPIAMVTNCVVDKGDPAFRNPCKPIGSWMREDNAKAMAETMGWAVREDSGRGWRRVVASPLPNTILEEEAIKAAVEAGFLVIACGGGGIPVIYNELGDIEGIEAVIDKDRTSALLARLLGADLLVLPTGVAKVALDFGKPEQRWLDMMTVSEAETHMTAGQFDSGSMAPKVEALLDFVRSTGGAGVITSVEHMCEAAKGNAGTRIVRG